MRARAVAVFLYGSYINLEVLTGVDIHPEPFHVAVLPGYALTVRPLANLVPLDRGTTYGIVTALTHGELDRLYAHARDVLGGVYVPEAVLTRRLDGTHVPALSYVAHDLAPGDPDPAYVDRILGAAREHRFPGWYLSHIASFLPGASRA